MIIRILVIFAGLCSVPLQAGAQRVPFVPPDSLTPADLVARWEEEMNTSIGGVRTSRWRAGLGEALGRFRTDPARADAVRDELEELAYRSTTPEVKRAAIIRIVSGYTVTAEQRSGGLPDTRPLARRFERMYHASSDEVIRRSVLSNVGRLGGSGRPHALTWLAPLITQAPEEQAFPGEATAAMRSASSLGPAGQALVVRLRDAGQIKDEDARFWSGFISVGGG